MWIFHVFPIKHLVIFHSYVELPEGIGLSKTPQGFQVVIPAGGSAGEVVKDISPCHSHVGWPNYRFACV